MSTDTREMWNYADVCRFTRLGRRTIEYAVACGKIRCLRIGRRVLFDPAAVREWLASYQSSNK